MQQLSTPSRETVYSHQEKFTFKTNRVSTSGGTISFWQIGELQFLQTMPQNRWPYYMRNRFVFSAQNNGKSSPLIPWHEMNSWMALLLVVMVVEYCTYCIHQLSTINIYSYCGLWWMVILYSTIQYYSVRNAHQAILGI